MTIGEYLKNAEAHQKEGRMWSRVSDDDLRAWKLASDLMHREIERLQDERRASTEQRDGFLKLGGMSPREREELRKMQYDRQRKRLQQ